MIIDSVVLRCLAEHMPGASISDVTEALMMVKSLFLWPQMIDESDAEYNDATVVGICKRADKLVANMKRTDMLVEE
jgi:hypothetical protein